MKRILFLLAAGIYLQVAAGQTTLRVCSYVDGDGKTTTAQNIISIRDGDELKMLVNSDKVLETSRLDYKIYTAHCIKMCNVFYVPNDITTMKPSCAVSGSDGLHSFTFCSLLSTAQIHQAYSITGNKQGNCFIAIIELANKSFALPGTNCAREYL